MNKLKRFYNYFTLSEKIIWSVSVILIVATFVIFDRCKYLNLIASIIGVTSLMFNAKGNPVGQVLVVVFSVIYGIISYSFKYYGEMITYIGMTAPMAILALITWLKNPYKGNRSQVKVNRLRLKELWLIFVLTAAVTVSFYYILQAFNTANLIVSTISVATSFVAVYLTFRRSEYFAVAYALNDIVLIVLWSIASISDITYISVVICFVAFLINDVYGFISWRKMNVSQNKIDTDNCDNPQ